jgi:hypothetical protein
MSTPLLILIGCGAAFGCWALLTLMGGERTRRLGELRVQRPTSASPSPTLLSVEPRAAGIAQPLPSHKPKPAKAQGPVAGNNAR